MGLLQQALVMDPDFALAHAWVATGYVFLVEAGVEWQTVCDVTFASAEKAVELAPGEAESSLALGLTYFRDRQPSLATQYLDRAIELDANNIVALTLGAQVATWHGEAEKAYSLRRQALLLNPLDPQANVTLAWSLLQLGDGDQALKHVERAIELDPSAITHFLVANFHWLAGDHFRAAQAMLTAHETDPTNLQYLTGMTLLFHWLGDTETAWDWLSKAEAVSPNHEDIWILKLDLLASEERYEESGKTISDWAAHNPASLNLRRYQAGRLQRLAREAYKEERVQEAAELNQQAFELVRESAERLRGGGGRLVADFQTSWTVLTCVVAAKTAGDETAFEEGKAALETLYASRGSFGWEGFQLAVTESLSGNRDQALALLRETPGSGFNAVWILDSLEDDPYGHTDGVSDDLAYRQVKSELLAQNQATLVRLREELPSAFTP